MQAHLAGPAQVKDLQHNCLEMGSQTMNLQVFYNGTTKEVQVFQPVMSTFEEESLGSELAHAPSSSPASPLLLLSPLSSPESSSPSSVPSLSSASEEDSGALIPFPRISS
jgi:hypothetical protein